MSPRYQIAREEENLKVTCPLKVGSHFDGKDICRHKIGKRRRDREASYLKKRSTTDPDATLQYRPGTGCMLSCHQLILLQMQVE